jgi:glycine C-acetyltransferase
LCTASQFRDNHADMKQLETQLKRAQKNRFRMIATDGVFSMDGDVAPIKEICELAKRYQAIVMVDDSHATGFFGATGRGSIEYQDALGEVQIITSTFGKALGGASGGFTAASHKLVSLLRQRSRPYLFSNSLSPVIAATTLKAIELIAHSPDLIRKLQDNTLFFRKEIEEAGFDIRPGSHPIIPIMLGEEHLAKTMADKLLAEGVYVIGFSHPVVPRGQARIRVQISAVHEREDIDQAVAAFQKIGRELGVIT